MSQPNCGAQHACIMLLKYAAMVHVAERVCAAAADVLMGGMACASTSDPNLQQQR
jgi:hypothetical protein